MASFICNAKLAKFLENDIDSQPSPSLSDIIVNVLKKMCGYSYHANVCRIECWIIIE